MHSAIFQLSNVPISKKDYITQKAIPDSFKWVADYWSTANNRGWTMSLADYTEDFATIEDGMFKINKSKLEQYLMWKFHIVKLIINDVKNANDYVDVRYRLMNKISDESGFYIFIDGRLEPFDDFIGNILRRCENEEITYYIGGIIDYHF